MSIEVTGQTLEASVGELIELHPGYTTQWGTLKSVQWDIPGEIVQYYDGDQQGYARVTPFPAADKTNFKIAFYWVDGGEPAVREVKANCVYTSQGADVSKTLTVTYKVYRPRAKFTSTTGRVDVYGNHHTFGVGLSYGLASNSVAGARPGIEWCAEVTTVAKGKGKLRFVQLICGRRWYVTDAGSSWEWAQPQGRFDLDVCNPYDKGAPFNRDGEWDINDSETIGMGSEDSPGSSLAQSARAPEDSDRTLIKMQGAHDRFQLWLMYKPLGCPAIWVPLSKIKWSWQGTAVRDDRATLGWVIRNRDDDPNPSGIKTTRVKDFPEWENISKHSKKWVKK
jgi:hypothetical protein